MRVEATGPLCVSHHPRPPPLHLSHHRQRKTFPSLLEQPRTLPVCVGEHHIIAPIYVDFTTLAYHQNVMLLLGSFHAPNPAQSKCFQLLGCDTVCEINAPFLGPVWPTSIIDSIHDWEWMGVSSLCVCVCVHNIPSMSSYLIAAVHLHAKVWVCKFVYLDACIFSA